MKQILIGLSLAALTAAGAAAAQDRMKDRMQGADMMGGKTITRDEAAAQAAKMFDRLDTNHDGKLDSADRQAEMQQHKAAMFDKLDTNHDGMISRDEFMAAGPGGPGEPGMDKPGPMGGKGRMGGWRQDGGERGGERGGAHGEMMMAMADANHDGVVTRDEFVAARLKMFDMADTNHDGQLTPEERKAAHASMRGAMGGRMHGDGDMPPSGGN